MREAEGWRVELSPAAVEGLRRLPRDEQRRVARRIEDLEKAGPPPSYGEREELELPAGEHVLRCLADRDARRLVVVSLRRRDVTAGATVVARLRRWVSGLTRAGAGEMARDVRHAARALRRAPGFTAAAVLTLSLGIGATTAVFSVADGVLLSPLPYRAPDRVVTIWSQWTGFPKTWVSAEEYVNYVQENRTLDGLALYFTSGHTFTSADDPELVESAVVTANLFEVLGTEPVIGRAFTWQEGLAEAPVVVLSHEVWQRRFQGDRSLVGRSVEINGQPFTVLGVLPPGFHLPVDYATSSASQVFFALPVDPDMVVEVPENGGSHGYYTVGRLRDGVRVEEARADIERIAGALEAAGVYTEAWSFRPLLFPVRDDVVGTAGTTIWFLLGACGLVLLIACGNVANLLLSRAEGRIRDVAVRRALGAGRARIVRQLFAESLLLAGVGGVAGLGLAAWGVRTLLAIDPEAVPRAAAVSVDARVVLFALAASGLTAVLFGWMPALRVAREGVAGTLHQAGRGSSPGVRAARVQGLLVAGQMAMAVLLLAASGLMMRTFVELVRVDLGFDTDEVLTARLTVPSASYPDSPEVTAFWDELLRRVRETPGVAAAGAARLLPLDGQMGDSGFRPVGYVPAEGESMSAEWQYVSAGYLEAMRIPVVAGRAFDERDRADAPTVMMINEAAARRFWPGQDPIGARVDTFGGDTALVVGVVGDLRHNGVTAEIKPRYYRSIHQLDGPGNIRRMTVVVKAERDAAALAGPLRTIVRELDPTMPLSRVQTLDDVASDALAQPRFAMVLLAAFATIALALAVVGVYGVLAYAVGRRTREIGVRMALGAERSTVVGMVVRQGMTMALAGVLVGTLAALAFTDLMTGMLYGVTPQDPVTFITVPLAFAAVALAACWIPAARAARVQPTEALRFE